MPTIAFKTRIRTVSDNCTLDLVVWHRLVAGEPSATPRIVKTPPPKSTDIVLVSPLTITTSGMLNNRRISAESFISSCIAQHILEYLKLNSSELGFEVVSDAHIAKDTGLLTFFCTASRPSRSLDLQSPHLKLAGFDIDYHWHETPFSRPPESSGLFDCALTPFSSRLSLPYVTALNTAIERFVQLQMVKRYPRIFGSWSQQLDMEKSFISSIFTSLHNISRRSSNDKFQASYRTRLKMLEKAMFSFVADSEIRLSGYLESPSPSKAEKCQMEGHEAIFKHAMEQVYCLAMKKRKFKSLFPSQIRQHTLDILYDQQPLSVGFEEEPHFGDSDDEGLNACWRECADGSGSATSSLSDDLFASDFDPMDVQPQNGQFLRTTVSPSDTSRDVEPSEFSSILDSLPTNPASDCVSMTVAPCLEHVDIFAAKVSTPSTSDSICLCLGSSGSLSSCTEDYHYHLLSEYQLERSPSNAFADLSYDSMLSQDISGSNFVTEDSDSKCDSPSLLSGNEYFAGDVYLKVSCFPQAVDVDLPVSGCVGGVDFVAMEF